MEWLGQDQWVDVVGLPPHSSHFSQPLDVGVMQPLKVGYTKVAEAYMARSGCKELREADVLLLLSQPNSLLSSVAETCAGMHRVVGISPWDLAM
mmetsp:Transcript_18255/g.51142  ORF Transcript_18255/g.51142 Transcript_18255/m.51142 type:complete len:94 (-) Transcript_18255:428-709(-)